MQFSDRFREAVGYAADAHAGHVRKGTGSPYVTHLLEVAALVLQYGGNETEAIGALLHDAVEDRGGLPRLEDIRSRFGDDVAAIVEGCSDSLVEDPTRKAPWRERKQAYIARVATEGPSARLVSAADKLANVRALRDDYREAGEIVWSRFNGGREGTLDYYRRVTDAFLAHGRSPLLDRLDRTVEELLALASNGRS
jgi:GTP pyrophosphokinase